MGSESGADRDGPAPQTSGSLGVLVAALILLGTLLAPFPGREDPPASLPPDPGPALAPPPVGSANDPPPGRPDRPGIPPPDPPPEPEPSPGPSPEPGIAFGMDAGTLDAQRAAGFSPDVATVWVGPWTLEHGWRVPDRLVREMVQADVTPALHVYYWGDDLSPSCLEHGCWSSLHDVYKDRAGWQTLVEETVEHLNRTLAGGEALILLESEFNKASVARYEPLDRYLAEKAAFIEEAYPPAKVVLALGNWNHAAWSTWDRAAGQAQAVGIQAMRASTRDTLGSQLGLFNATREGVEALSGLYDKPIVLQDISISSYPEPMYLQVQAKALARLFEGLDQLERMGVTTFIYRSWYDNPDKSTENYFGPAERYWGLVSYPEGEAKPAADVWLEGVQAQRRASTKAPAPAGPGRDPTRAPG